MKSNILMISHDSLLGGATIAFQYAARALVKQGYYVIWLVESDGAILKELNKDRIGYIIDPSFKGSSSWLNYASNFDLIICNTVLLCPQIEQLKNIGKQIIWWIHEASDYYTNELLSSFSAKNIRNLHVWCGGAFAEKKFHDNFIGIPTKIMLYGLPDYANSIEKIEKNIISNPNHKLVFLSIGTIETRKGQDILVEAIRKMRAYEREQCLFVFIGKPVHQRIYIEIENIAKEYPLSVIIKEPVERNTLMQIYQESDVVVCTSREDPMPVFMTECLMQSRIAICSENTGTADIIQDGYNGFIYHDNSASELIEKISYVLKNHNEMQQIRKNARKTYEIYFSMEAFEKKLRDQINKILEG